MLNKAQDTAIYDENASNWHIVLEKLHEKYGDEIYQSWFKSLSLEDVEAGIATISTNTRFIRDWVLLNYKKDILLFWGELDSSVIKIEVITNSRKIEVVKPQNQPIKQSNILLDDRFTFENFVIGESNKIAYSSAMEVATSKKVKAGLNPLFIKGKVGLGKTHLLQAIAQKTREKFPAKKILYMPAERFMFEFIKALQHKEIMSFKDRLRNVDILLIDDIQFIAGKETTQEEFFHTLNTLLDEGKQVVIASDRSPTELIGMDDRIKSRLGWGLVAEISNADNDLRSNILKHRIQAQNINIEDEAISFIAQNITSNIRELEGALNKIAAHCNMMTGNVNIACAENILKDLLRSNIRVITIANIQKKVADYYKISQNELISNRRSRNIARPRQIAMYLAKKLTTKSLPEIGHKFGGKDHTTVIHSVKKIEELIKSDIEISEAVAKLRAEIE